MSGINSSKNRNEHDLKFVASEMEVHLKKIYLKFFFQKQFGLECHMSYCDFRQMCFHKHKLSSYTAKPTRKINNGPNKKGIKMQCRGFSKCFNNTALPLLNVIHIAVDYKQSRTPIFQLLCLCSKSTSRKKWSRICIASACL